MPTGQALDITALVVWLVTEALGAFMVRSWIASGAARTAQTARRRTAGQRPGSRPPTQAGAMSLPILIGHAGLNVAGLLCWIVFLVVDVKAAAWLALAFMAPAIGLGISTVTIWTPYPARQPAPGGGGEPAEPAGEGRSGVLPDELVKRALEDDALSRKLVDELLSLNLAPPPARKAGWNLRPLIPLAHGVLAIATFLLVTLAVTASI